MTTEHDLADIFTEFAALAPTHCASFDEARASSRRTFLSRHQPILPPTRRRRIRVAVAGLLGVGLVGGGGAFAYSQINTPRVTDDTVVTCYASPTYGPDADYLTLHEQHVVDGPLTHLNDAVGACARMWREGLLPIRPGGGANVDPKTPHRVPALTACILPDGTAAVFPSPATCTSVGLPGNRPGPSR